MNSHTTLQYTEKEHTAQSVARNQPAKPIHYIMWQIGPGGLELGTKHYSERFYAERRLHVYGLRSTWKQIFDESKVSVKSGDDGKLRPYWQYFRYCRQHRRDVFHLQSVGPFILLLTLIAGVKDLIYHIHGTIYWRTALQKIYLGNAWRLADWLLRGRNVTFIANSQYSGDIFRNKVLPRQLEIVYNGMVVEKFAEVRHHRTELRRIGYAGRLWNGKNVDLVLRLFDEIAAAHPALELHLAGDGPLRPELEAQAARSPYASRIKFHGYVNDVPTFYADMDLFLFLSAYESFGNVIAEALVTGLPPLTSNVPVFSEIFGKDSEFMLGDPADYETLKQQFLKAVANFPQLAAEAWEISQDVEARCSLQNHLLQIEKIYEKY